MIMRLKNNINVLALSIIVVLSMTGCKSNNNHSSSSHSDTSTKESSSDITSSMSESYRIAREEFLSITGIELPEVSGLIVETHKDNDDFLIDIKDGPSLKYQTYYLFENFFKDTLGNPKETSPSTGEKNDRYAKWEVVNRSYMVSWVSSEKHIKIETAIFEVEPVFTNSYQKARNQFLQVTNIELPIVYDVIANKTPIDNYQIGQTSYQIILDDGTNLNYQTYQVFESFFSSELGNMDSGYPKDISNEREAKWVANEREYYTRYTSDGYIVISTNLVVPAMTESYEKGRELFHQIIGIWLPELYKVELLETSNFDVDNQTAQFDIPGNSDLYLTLNTYLKASIDEPPLNETENDIIWNYLYFSNGRNHRFSLDMSFANSIISIKASIIDYYTIQVTSDDRGSAIINNNHETYIVATSNEVLSLFAKTYLGYVFEGWYVNSSLVSVDNPLSYTVLKEDITFEARFMIDASDMSNSYQKAREEFYEVTDIILPALDGLEVEDYQYNPEDLSYSLNITSGINLSYQTYETFLSFFDNELSTWNKENVELSGNNKRVIYTSSYIDQISLEWDDANGYIHINAFMSGYYGVNSFNQGRLLISELFNIDLPVYDNVSITNNSFKRDGKEVEFGFKSDNFSVETFNEIKDAISYSFGNPIEETTSSASWENDEYEISLKWDANIKSILIEIVSTI